jgi:phospholipase C
MLFMLWTSGCGGAPATMTAPDPQAISPATTVTPDATLSSIKHIVIMVQENRSADNYFSRLSAYKASRGWPGSYDGASPTATLKDYDGKVVSRFHYDTMCTENTSPGWNETHFFDHKRADGSWGMDFFMMQKTDSQKSTIDPRVHRTMGYYTSADLPYYYALAGEFATSDRFFSSVLATTAPNRMYLFSATSQGHIRPDVNGHPLYTWPTIFRKLANAGISFGIYYQDKTNFIKEWTDGSDTRISPKIHSISTYYSTLSSSNADTALPAVVFIERAGGLDEHPLNNVQKGANDVHNIIQALMRSSAWHDSVFILAFDESGGLYDHVPPVAVVPPDSITPMFQSGDLTTGADGKPFGFNVTGNRIPLIVISPWSRPHYVSHTAMEETSILKFVESRFGLTPLTQRDAHAPNMTEFFDFTTAHFATPPALPTQPTSGKCSFSLETTPAP